MKEISFTKKDVKEGMVTVKEASVYLWAYLYWNEQLKQSEEGLKKAEDKEVIGTYRYWIIEAMNIISELYEKLITFPEFSGGMITKPEWLEDFLNLKSSM